MSFPISAALLEAIVLSVVAQEPEGTYGYKITQQVTHTLELSESTLYPVLRRLQKDQLLTVYDAPFNGRNLHLFDGSVPTLVFTEAPHAPLPNVEYLPVSDYRRDVLPEIMETLYTRGLQSLLVEGGSQTLQSFIDAGLWDEIFVEEAPYLLHSGVKAPEISDGYPFATEYSFGRSFRHYTASRNSQ